MTRKVKNPVIKSQLPRLSTASTQWYSVYLVTNPGVNLSTASILSTAWYGGCTRVAPESRKGDSTGNSKGEIVEGWDSVVKRAGIANLWEFGPLITLRPPVKQDVGVGTDS